MHSSYRANQTQAYQSFVPIYKQADSVITLSQDVWLRMPDRDKARAAGSRRGIALIKESSFCIEPFKHESFSLVRIKNKLTFSRDIDIRRAKLNPYSTRIPDVTYIYI